MNTIEIFPAKNGFLTAKIFCNEQWQLVYSKYDPLKSLKVPSIEQDKSYTLIGSGLGYEACKVLSEQSQHLEIWEKHSEFRIETHKSLKERGIKSHNYKIQNCQNTPLQLQVDTTIFSQSALLEWKDYASWIIRNQQTDSSKRAIVIQHPTIAQDCVESLEEQGFTIYSLKLDTLPQLALKMALIAPQFIVSINLNELVQEASKHLNIPYHAWVVDTPTYSLHRAQVQDPHIQILHYDKQEVSELEAKGIKNISYLPVAGNTPRMMQKVHSPSSCIDLKNAVTFVGSSGADHELQHLNLNNSKLNWVRELFELQRKSENQCVLANNLTDELVDLWEKDIASPLPKSDFLSSKERLSYILGRWYSSLERIATMTLISQHFPCIVFGDPGWLQIKAPYFQYAGPADHFEEMPNILHHSAINLNLTRIYVKSGLPMRVFDTLACKGFLLSNNRGDMSSLLRPQLDLALFDQLSDLLNQIEFYLSNPQERQRIAEHGHNTVVQQHQYKQRIKSISFSK